MPTTVPIRLRGGIVERKAAATDVAAWRRSIATLGAES
jgi:hypothetical protein